jgi:hypothetical protein
MKLLTVVIWICLSAATAAQATTTTPVLPCATATCGLKAAPAPLIGTGIPAVLVVGGVLLGAKLLARRRRA